MAKLFSWPYFLAKKFNWHSLTAGIDLLNKKERRMIIFISGLITISKFIEMGALASAMPVIALIIQPELLQEQQILNDLYMWYGSPDVKIFISVLAILSATLILLGAISEFLTFRIIFLFTARCESRLANDMMNDCTTAPYHWHSDNNSISLMRLFQVELQSWSQLFLRSFLNLFSQSLTIIIGAFIVLSLAKLKALIVLVVFGSIIFCIMRIVRPRTLLWSNRQSEAVKLSVINGSNILTGNKEFRFSLNQNHFITKFQTNYADRTNASALKFIWGNVAPRIILVIGQFCLLFVALTLWLSGESNAQIVSQMTVLLLITSKVIPATNQLIGSFNSFWSSSPWIETIHVVNKSIRRANKQQPQKRNTIQPPENWSEISLKNINFSYETEREHILKDASLKIKSGKHYGFIGPSGSGKSSLIGIIALLFPPTSGNIFVDGINLIDVEETEWRRHIGLVSQDPFFIDDTVRNNIAYGCDPEEIDDGLIWESLAASKMDDVIRNLSEGLNTVLGEQSSKLSGGQRQRIAIARALYKKPQLLILDEATSALDAESEQRILETISGLHGKVTVLNISHRPSAVEICDEVFKLEHGSITRLRTH